MAQSKGLMLETVWHGPLALRYRGDPIRLGQMLSNLVSNAIKFTAHGCVRVEASEIERKEKEAVLEFVAIDSGMGIAQDKQARLFQPFSQVDADAANSGALAQGQRRHRRRHGAAASCRRTGAQSQAIGGRYPEVDIRLLQSLEAEWQRTLSSVRLLMGQP